MRHGVALINFACAQEIDDSRPTSHNLGKLMSAGEVDKRDRVRG
jgi:hypothetical protein